MNNKVKAVLTESQKEFIRRCYKKGIGSSKILSRLQRMNPLIKYHHMNKVVFEERLGKVRKSKPVVVREGFFDIDIYKRNVFSI